MAVDITVKASPTTLTIVRDLLERQVQALYDDPYGVCNDDAEINVYHHQLKVACEDLRVDWEATLKRDTTENERRRMWAILNP